MDSADAPGPGIFNKLDLNDWRSNSSCTQVSQVILDQITRPTCSPPSPLIGRLLTNALVNLVTNALQIHSAPRPHVDQTRTTHLAARSQKLRTYFLGSILSCTTSLTLDTAPANSPTHAEGPVTVSIAPQFDLSRVVNEGSVAASSSRRSDERQVDITLSVHQAGKNS
jgi:hypothetical protein